MAVGGVLGIAIELVGKDTGFGQMLDRMRSGFTSMMQIGEQAKASLVANFDIIKDSAGRVFKTGALLKGLQDFSKEASDVNQTFRDLKVFAGASVDDIDKAQKAIFATGTALKGFDSTAAASALTELAKSTNSVDDSLKLLQPSLALARLGFNDPAQSADFLAKTLTQFRLEATDGARVTDTLAVAMTKFGVKADEARAGFNSLAKASNISRIGFEEVTIAATLAGAGLRGGFAEGAQLIGRVLDQATTDAKKSLKRFGASDAGDLFGAFEKLAAKIPTTDVQKFGQSLTKLQASKAEVRAFSAIFEGVQQTIEKSGGTIKNTKEAVAKLREEFGKGKGQAELFAQGLVSGSKIVSELWKSIRTEAARILSVALKPVTDFLVQTLLKMKAFWDSIAAPFKEAVARGLVFVAVAASIFGGLIALKVVLGAVIGLVWSLIPGVIALGASFIAANWPLLLLIATFVALKKAYDDNIGGFADTINKAWDKIKIAWAGINQAFTTGGLLSGKVLEDLEKNPSLFDFVHNVYIVWQRLKSFWSGFTLGFDNILFSLEPVFQRIGESFNKLLSLFGIGGSALDSLASTTGASWFEAGKVIGEAIGFVADLLLSTLAGALETISSIVDAGKNTFKEYGHVWNSLAVTGKELFDIFRSVVAVIAGANGPTNELTFSWKIFGETIAKIVVTAFAILAQAIQVVIDAVNTLIKGLETAIRWTIELPGRISGALGRFHKKFRFSPEERGLGPDEAQAITRGNLSGQDIEEAAAARRGNLVGTRDVSLPSAVPTEVSSIGGYTPGDSNRELAGLLGDAFQTSPVEQNLTIVADGEVLASLARKTTRGEAVASTTFEFGE